MLRLFKQLREVGVSKKIPKEVAKKARLVNMICLIWGSFILAYLLKDSFVYQDSFPEAQITHAFALFGIGLTFLGHYYHRFELAKLILVFNIISQTIIFSYVLMPGNMLELNFCLFPPLSMLFIKNRRWHLVILVICMLFYIVPNVILDPNGTALHFPMTRMTLFLVVKYFLNLYEKNENHLAQQKKHIEDLYAYKNQFFINVTHEIRTPLTILSGNLNRLPLSDINSEESKAMKRQIDIIKKIVDDVLDLSKMDTGQFVLRKETVQLSNFITRIFDAFRSNFESKKIDYQLLNYLQAESYLSADQVFLERVLNNIIHNAFKYTPEGGKVHVLIENDAEGQLLIRIKDNGIGIPAEFQSKIFDQFYQINNDINAAGGSGVGLAFSKEVITKLGGKLDVTSKPGSGSEFTITFAKQFLSQEMPLDTTVSSSLDIEKSVDFRKEVIRNAQNVLVVEDHCEMREFIKSSLSGYNVIDAANGKEALQLLEKQSVDLIITDYMMPVMDGLALVNKLRTLEITCPVIVLTARTDQKAKMDMLRLGVDDYMTKPFEEEELLARVKNRLVNAHERNIALESENQEPENALPDSGFVANVVDYIKAKCDNSQLSVDLICEEFNLSASSLYRKIKSETGLSPKNLITELRLFRVREILEVNPETPRKELAISVGLGNTTYLSRLYEKRFGKRL